MADFGRLSQYESKFVAKGDCEPTKVDSRLWLHIIFYKRKGGCRMKKNLFGIISAGIMLHHVDRSRSSRHIFANVAYAAGNYAFSTKPTGKGYQLSGTYGMEKVGKWTAARFFRVD